MLDELQRRNYAQSTVDAYISALRDFANYFHQPPDQLGPEQVRQFQLHLLRDRKLAANTVKQRMVIPAGGLSPDHKSWVRPRYPFFLPVRVLSRVFRGKFLAGLKRAFRKGELCLPGILTPLQQDRAFRVFLRPLFRQDWIVYAKRPSADRSMFSTTWPATRTASPSPITDWSASEMAMSRSAGKTMRTATNAG